MHRSRFDGARFAPLCKVIVGLTTVVAFAVSDRAAGSPASRERTHDAYALAYNLQFAACYDLLARAAALDPLDPAPPRATAAVTWIEILFSQGVATFEAFSGELSNADVARPVAPAALVDRYRAAFAEARRRATAQVAREDTADAHYQMGATEALGALFGATVEGRLLGSFTQGRRAVAAMDRARMRDAGRHEAALVLGLSEYTVSTMSWPVRTLARLSGLSGSRTSGLALLQEAASPGAETESDALLLLMIVDHREGRPADAIARLQHLRRLHPANRLLWLNLGTSMLVAGRLSDAVETLSGGITKEPRALEPVVLGEGALWRAHRGAAMAGLHRPMEAMADFEQGLLLSPRDWVRGRIHGQIAAVVLEAGDLGRARAEYATAIEFAERGGDRQAAKELKLKLKAMEDRQRAVRPTVSPTFATRVSQPPEL